MVDGGRGGGGFDGGGLGGGLGDGGGLGGFGGGGAINDDAGLHHGDALLNTGQPDYIPQRAFSELCCLFYLCCWYF